MDKTYLYHAVEEKAPVITGISDKIWEYAELSMMEVCSTAEYVSVLKQEGFTVQENLCGIATAFSGSFGSGRPVIGFLGEYDALSALSQAAGLSHPHPLTEGGCGHGCGHNLLGAGSLGAAIAVKKAIEAGLLKGTVVFYGCPGEEGCAGKTFMARDGMFRDLDAAELMNVGVQFLREHMRPKESVHYSFTDAGGISPNVVQPTATLIYMIRGETVRTAKALARRVDDIAKGAALMTGTTVTSHQIDGTANTLSNSILEQLLHDNLMAAPLPEYTQEEILFARKMKATFAPSPLPGQLTNEDPRIKKLVIQKTENGRKAINDFVFPYVPSYKFSSGSTDVGDVSWLTPTAQFDAVTWPSGSPGHSWQNVSMGKTSMAHKGMLMAAKVLAGAAADLMENPALLAQVRDEFEITAADGYDCPIGPEVVPVIG